MADMVTKIQDDIKIAMKEKDRVKLDTLRLLKTAILNLQTSGKNIIIDDNAVISLIRKALKQREEASIEFQKAGRTDASDKELLEAQILKMYLPTEMSDDELEKLITNYLNKEALHEKKDFGRAMKALQLLVAGKADSKKISHKLNEALK